jgi:aminoglycoside phosphotransferase (APT) family kinase protein
VVEADVSIVDFLPAALSAALERQTGGRIVAARPRAGGGASRQGAELEFAYPGGRLAKGYLSYDSRTADPERLAFFRREVAILSALSSDFAGSGVRAPRYMASSEEFLALLTGFVDGTDRMAPDMDATERDAVHQDFMAQLVALHRIDPAPHPLSEFGDAEQPVSARIRARIAQLRQENLDTAPDPVLQLALNWLEDNVPCDLGPAVIVHGDAGSGNFLHAGGRVTAMVDWELCHYGDPMEDLAGIWVRMLFNPFMAPAAMFAAYERAGGVPVDLNRVRYHRLYFQLGFTVGSHAAMAGEQAVEQASLGITMLFYTAHMRVIVLSLAELMGVSLGPVFLPDAPASPADRSYAAALDDIRQVIAPRATDQQAAAKAKSLARLIKWWRARDRWGPLYAQTELDEAAAQLGSRPPSVADARRELALAVRDRRIDPVTALRVCHGRVVRDTALMADAMGSIAGCYFPPA